MRLWRSGLEHIPAFARGAVRSARQPWPLIRPGHRAVAVAAVVLAALTLAGLATGGAFAGAGRPAQSSPAPASPPPASAAPAGPAPASPAPANSAAARPAGRAAGLAHRAASGPVRPAPRRRSTAVARRRPLRTSCHSVAHIGDSTSVGMISAAVLPDPAQRLAARYAQVGVRHLLVDASGGRSIEEVLPGQVNGYDVARGWVSHGYRGCWVLALGTNDTANVSVGSDLSRMARIKRMMSAARGEPVLWVDTRTLLPGGPWAESNMRAWNATLRAACARYPDMRIFDWASVAGPGWYLSDGIHYTPAGYAVRARTIAAALARAFGPAGASGGAWCASAEWFHLFAKLTV